MRVFIVDRKRIVDFEVANRIAQAKKISFYVKQFHFDGKSVAVKVRATDGNRVEEEVVAFTVQALIDELDKELPNEKEKNRIRAENYAVQFAVERAKKSLTGKFMKDGKPYLSRPIKLFEELELFNLYIGAGIRRFKKLAETKPELAYELAVKYHDLSKFVPITEKQRRLIKKLVRDRNIPDAEYRRMLGKYKVSSSLCLNKAEASDFIGELS